jgi:hypothetical protein
MMDNTFAAIMTSLVSAGIIGAIVNFGTVRELRAQITAMKDSFDKLERRVERYIFHRAPWAVDEEEK